MTLHTWIQKTKALKTSHGANKRDTANLLTCRCAPLTENLAAVYFTAFSVLKRQSCYKCFVVSQQNTSLSLNLMDEGTSK